MKVHMYAHHLTKLNSCALTAEDATRAGFTSMTGAVVASMALGENTTIPGDCLAIPYFNEDGSPVINEASGAQHTRYRVFSSDANYKTKYLSVSGSQDHAYIPVGLSDCPMGLLVITEGEFKAYAGVAHQIACIGIAGVTMGYSSSRNKDTKRDEDTPVLPAILELASRHGRVIVLADSDATENANVRSAMQSLASAIRKQTSAVVAYASVPANGGGKRDRNRPPPEKMGLDDWIFKLRDDVAPIRRLLDGVITKEVARLATMESGGYTALGYRGDICFAWSKGRKHVVQLSASSITSSGVLASLAGNEWAEKCYGVEDADTGKVTVNWNRMGLAIIDECTAKGFYDESSERGVGVWRAKDGGLIVNAETVYRPDGQAIDRVSDDNIVYPIDGGPAWSAGMDVATTGDVAELITCLKRWKWVRESDMLITLGWLGLAFVGGALEWRPNLSLTGIRGSGKSTYAKLFCKLLGEQKYAISFALGKTSEAGIRSLIRSSSRPIIVDEFESDNRNAAAVLDMLRISSSGDKIYKSSATGTSVQYEMRSIGLIAGVTLPNFNGADHSRFLCVDMKEIPADEKENVHPMMQRNFKQACELGPKLAARMQNSWERLNDAIEVARSALKAQSARFSDTYAPVFASLHCMLSDDVLTPEQAIEYAKMIDLDSAKDRNNEGKTEVSILTHILSTVVSVNNGGTRRLTVAEVASYALGEGRLGGVYKSELGALGMAVGFAEDSGMPTLHINQNSSGFQKLFANSAWSNGQVASNIKRLPGAAQKALKTMRIGGIPCKPLSVPVDIEVSEPAQEESEMLSRA